MGGNAWKGLIVFLLFLGRAGWAEELTLSDCVRLAQARSAQVLQALHQQASARAALTQARSRGLPQLSLQGNLDVSDDSSRQLPDSNQAVLRAEQDLNPLSPSWAEARQRSAELSAAAFSVSQSAQEAGLAARELYFSVLRDQAGLASLDRVRQREEALERAVLPRYDLGRAAPLDLVKVRVTLAVLRREHDLLDLEIQDEKAEFALLLGLPQDTSLQLKAIENLPAIPEGEADAKENFSLQALAMESRAARQGLVAAQLSFLPELVGGAEYGYSGMTYDQMEKGWDLTLALKAPLWDWGQLGSQVTQSRQLLALAEEELEQESRRKEHQVRRTRQAALAQHADWERLESLLPQLSKAVDVTVSRYARGAAGILEAGEAVDLWLDTLNGERTAFYGYLSDLAELEALSGGKAKVDYGQ
jgi:outer membrane protein TolC